MSEHIPEIDWSPKPTLRPGVDFHGGVAYFTVPLLRNVLKPSKKKDEEPTLVKEVQTYVVNSDHTGMWYEQDALDRHGFQINDQLMQDPTSRWSLPSVKAWLDKKTEPVTAEAMFARLKDIYTRYVEFADETYYTIMPLFVMYTYVFRLFESTGYIHFNGTMASGKSRNLSILNALAFNTIWASSMSAAALYRRLAGNPGTTCIDESEGFEGERGEELRRILNAGYKDGSKVTRAEKGPNDRFISVMFDVYSPKTLASINPLDAVIASRCLIVNMRPAIRELPDFMTHHDEWNKVRDMLYVWAITDMAALDRVAQAWRNDSPEGKKARLCPKLIGRQWETTAQYIVLADYIAGEDMAATLITFFNEYFAKQQENADATDRLRTTLRCLPRVLATKPFHEDHYYTTKDIHEVVSSYMEVDATEFFKTRHVTKNLDILGFRKKKRASGGVQIQLDEDAVRREFEQRRVEPFDEDLAWLAGEVHYQTGQTLFDEPHPVVKVTTTRPWWDPEDGPDMDELIQ